MAIIYKHRKEPVPQLPERFAFLQPIVERLLAKLPQDRFSTAQEAAEALEAVMGRVAELEAAT
jgi:hypothetical protein